MSRRFRSFLIAIGLIIVAALIGGVLGNVWLGLVLGVLIGIGVLMAFESKRGGNQGIYDRDDDGTEL
ncbi:hypothetical protein [Microbacterium sp. G2-8]|uniref:hypothetical protein n=1 Tax=Microbacterium sp. G2-8 TaxID=2842454 RepID=UPI001C89D894|nr:hypothetical protein [Microbacterium sp. G2-8]